MNHVISIAYVTHASADAAKLFCEKLLQKKMIACYNLFPMQSGYWWQGAIAQDDEWISILKTQTALIPALEKQVSEAHPYDTPCFVHWQVQANKSYADWIIGSTISQS